LIAAPQKGSNVKFTCGQTSRFFEPYIVTHICQQNQQNAHVFH